MAPHEVNFGAPAVVMGSEQPSLTRDAACTLAVTVLAKEPPTPVPAVAEFLRTDVPAGSKRLS
ncbi:hypothetical protein [Bifidobacterium erythrocebi]|uniref:hypothetical protein n=1 Tax=Bifidobacterium erythrocebi TaxID=2675325 RepID=UPI00145E6276